MNFSIYLSVHFLYIYIYIYCPRIEFSVFTELNLYWGKQSPWNRMKLPKVIQHFWQRATVKFAQKLMSNIFFAQWDSAARELPCRYDNLPLTSCTMLHSYIWARGLSKRPSRCNDIKHIFLELIKNSMHRWLYWPVHPSWRLLSNCATISITITIKIPSRLLCWSFITLLDLCAKSSLKIVYLILK